MTVGIPLSVLKSMVVFMLAKHTFDLNSLTTVKIKCMFSRLVQINILSSQAVISSVYYLMTKLMIYCVGVLSWQKCFHGLLGHGRENKGNY